MPFIPLIAIAILGRVDKKKIKKIIPTQLMIWLYSHGLLLRAWLLLFEKENKDLELLPDSTFSGFVYPSPDVNTSLSDQS